MNDVIIRGIRPSDMPQIEELLATRPELGAEGAKKRAKLMEWIAFCNPCADGEDTYFVAEQQRRIIAFHGRMPSEFNFRGNIKKGYFIHDLYVDPKSRKKGMGFWLTVAFAREIEENSPHFFILIWMTKFNLQLQRRRGYLELEDRIETYKKILKSRKHLKPILKYDFMVSIAAPLVDMGLKIWETIRVNKISPQEILVKVARFDDRYDELMERIGPSLGISSVRSSKVLNWRYIDRPFSSDTVFALHEGESVKGFVVVCNNPRDPEQGELLDLMADPNDIKTITSLITGVVKYFKSRGYHTVSCFMSNKEFSKHLRKCIFLKRKERKVVLLGNCKQDQIEYMQKLQNWHITKAESDGFMLNF